jgi:hypothetical protein
VEIFHSSVDLAHAEVYLQAVADRRAVVAWSPLSDRTQAGGPRRIITSAKASSM